MVFLFKGTTVSRGRGTAVVVAVLSQPDYCEFAKVNALVVEGDDVSSKRKTPLQKFMKWLARRATIVAVVIALLIPLLQLLFRYICLRVCAC